MSSLSVIHTVPAISDEASGPSYSVVRLAETMSQNGLNIKLATLDWSPSHFNFPFVKYFPLSFGPRRLGFSKEMKLWLSREVEFSKVDLLHNHSLWMMPNVYPGTISKKFKVPFVFSPRGAVSKWALSHGSKMKALFWTFFQKECLDSASCFHATSYSEYQDIRNLGFRQPVAIIPNGIDIPIIKYHKKINSRTIIFVGRIHPKKGLDILLPAWKKVQSRFTEWNLKVIGPDNNGYLNQMKLFAKELKLQRIEFLDPVFGEKKYQQYQEAEIFILPTYSENFGMTVAESLASGTPAIVSKGAPWSGLEITQSGWWIDIGVEPLVKCLEEVLLMHPEKLKQFGLNGRKWMSENYCWSTIASQMDLTYNWVINKNDKPDWILEH